MPPGRASIVGRSLSRSTVIGVVALVMIVIASGAFNRTDIQLRRQGCFGTCPVYDLEITGDGWVTYNGRAFVTTHGARQSRIAPGAVNALIADFGKAGFWALAPAYGVGGDGPANILSVTSGLRTKTVRFGSAAPAAIGQLADRVDALAGAARWTGTHPVVTAPPPSTEKLIAQPEPRH
jgi:hypothetical protein